MSHLLQEQNTSACSGHQQTALDRVKAALEERRFFKLICGGSFTEADKVALLTRFYSLAGVDCIDIAPDPIVVQRVIETLQALPATLPKPLLMVSLALDEDPHFRKAIFEEPSCIHCNVCVPVCPTDAIVVTGENQENLNLVDPLCYGCGRCVEACPTDALLFKRLDGVSAPIREILENPWVGAIEVHTTSLDTAILADFQKTVGPLIRHKAIAICFSPRNDVPFEQIDSFLKEVKSFFREASLLLLQIDGKPMSGSSHPDASLPALEGARKLFPLLNAEWPFFTVSGGINQYTAQYLQQPEYHFIAGVGMGTVARQWVWNTLSANSNQTDSAFTIEKARQLVTSFQQQRKTL